MQLFPLVPPQTNWKENIQAFEWISFKLGGDTRETRLFMFSQNVFLIDGFIFCWYCENTPQLSMLW